MLHPNSRNETPTHTNETPFYGRKRYLCIRQAAPRHNIQASSILCTRFALSLHKTGCTSAQYPSKLDIMHSVCTVFAQEPFARPTKKLYIYEEYHNRKPRPARRPTDNPRQDGHHTHRLPHAAAPHAAARRKLTADVGGRRRYGFLPYHASSLAYKKGKVVRQKAVPPILAVPPLADAASAETGKKARLAFQPHWPNLFFLRVTVMSFS